MCVYVCVIIYLFSMCTSNCLCVSSCAKSHLAQSLQKDGDARQSLGSPLVVTVTKHETHQLWISGAHRLLKNCRRKREIKRRRVKQSQLLRPHLKFMHMSNLRGAARIAETEVGQRKSWYDRLLQLARHSSGRHFAVNLTGCSMLEQLHNNFLSFPLSAHLWVQVCTLTRTHTVETIKMWQDTNNVCNLLHLLAVIRLGETEQDYFITLCNHTVSVIFLKITKVQLWS